MKLILLFALLSTLQLLAQQPEPPVVAPASKQPDIKKIDDHTYKISNITINSKERSISFPAIVEQDQVLLEFLISNNKGKIHEALFTADVVAQNLIVAFKLLNYKESMELLRILDKDMRATDKYHEVAEEVKSQARFTVNVSWEENGKKISSPVFDLIHHIETNEVMPPAPFIYHGSYLLNGELKADITGDIIATFVTEGSLANYSGKKREDDMYWTANAAKLPPIGTPVTITFTPWIDKK